ncbi:MAG: YbjQ family protein [Candidatus Thermoplasmatota archaeon]|nr:YbjQ family protein [Candidatus Thermoplasmatota archaeon]
MMVTTTEHIPNREVKEVLGIVFGSCVQTKHLGKDIGAGLRSVVGGEAKGYTELMEEARRTAMKRMIADAEQYGADAIIGMRYATAQTMHGAAEIIAFGTAVKTF